MTRQKRAFDICLAILLALLFAPIILLVALCILVKDGRPIFYVSERMKTADEPFQLVKFRTMSVAEVDSGVSGGDKAARITQVGRVLRAKRLDELPQLWNILRGDMSFVGPRPPLRSYVARFPQTYRDVLQNRPGVTGLATLVFHAHEERLIADCKTAEQTDAVYARRCVPRKARLDLIYAQNQNLCYDLEILAKTAAAVLPKRQ